MTVTNQHHMTPQRKAEGPVILCIMDGWGLAPDSPHNAVARASTPNIDSLWQSAPHSRLNASERWVGLPEGQPGNSEVGHMTIGAGRVILQDLPRISEAVSSGALAAHPELDRIASTLIKTGKSAHVTGLCSPGGVHAHSRHIAELANSLSRKGVTVWLHLITDGRDRLPQNARHDIPELLSLLDDEVRIASLCGRYFAMDRDKRWERTQKFINLVCSGQADHKAGTAIEALEAGYQRSETDEFITPTSLGDYDGMREGDGVIVANFRVDRVRQLFSALLFPDETELDLSAVSLPHQGPVLSMTPVSDAVTSQAEFLFGPADLSGGFGACIEQAGLSQLRLAETEKYPHVTYFFNGGDETSFTGEERVMVASPKVATYDLQPEMSAGDVLNTALSAINTSSHDVLIINFANPDMVGHTGSLSAAITAVETTDNAVGRLIEAVGRAGGTMLVTADHGNCEVMWDDAAQSPHTAHTTNQVPLMISGYHQKQIKALRDGSLADLAPTLLDLLGINPSENMTGHSLIDWS